MQLGIEKEVKRKMQYFSKLRLSQVYVEKTYHQFGTYSLCSPWWKYLLDEIAHCLSNHRSSVSITHGSMCTENLLCVPGILSGTKACVMDKSEICLSRVSIPLEKK